jgi:hypothetical protein
MPLPLAALGVAAGAGLVGAGISAWGKADAAKAAARAQEKAAAANKVTAEQGLADVKGTMGAYGEGNTGAMVGLKNLAAGPQYEDVAGYGGPTQFDPSTVDVTQDPGAKFRLQQSQLALDTSAAGKGALFSGAQQKALQENAQNLASQEYQNAYERAKGTFDTNFNAGTKVFDAAQAQRNLQQGRKTQDLQFMAGQGLNAAGTVANSITNTTGQLIGVNNQVGAAQGVKNSANSLALADMGGTLSSVGLDAGKMMAASK